MENAILYIDVNTIKENIKDIQRKVNLPVFLIVKSNFYGFGLGLVNYLIDDINGLFISDHETYKKLNLSTNYNKELSIVYPDYNNLQFIKNNINIVLNSINNVDNIDFNKKRCYIRIDIGLGLHGITYSEFLLISDLNLYKGVILYINEYVTELELKQISNIYNISIYNGLDFSIGGSPAIDIVKNFPRASLRIVNQILYKNTPFSFIIRIIKLLINQKDSIEIGFKSDRKIICGGTLILLAVGYGDFHALVHFYNNKIPIMIDETPFYLPCFPCMNTCWIYSTDEINLTTEYINILSPETIACLNEFSLDEITTAISHSLSKVYTND
ncbi:hypothetical protein CMU26_05770 [Elizabethkingia anophelis]|nr:hypothetical protein [Elizabethkingia anophelis]